jgi:hypothetical protein
VRLCRHIINAHRTHTNIHASSGIRTTIAVLERAKTVRALDRAATAIGCKWYMILKFVHTFVDLMENIISNQLLTFCVIGSFVLLCILASQACRLLMFVWKSAPESQSTGIQLYIELLVTHAKGKARNGLHLYSDMTKVSLQNTLPLR